MAWFSSSSSSVLTFSFLPYSYPLPLASCSFFLRHLLLLHHHHHLLHIIIIIIITHFTVCKMKHFSTSYFTPYSPRPSFVVMCLSLMLSRTSPCDEDAQKWGQQPSIAAVRYMLWSFTVTCFGSCIKTNHQAGGIPERSCVQHRAALANPTLR